LPDTQSAPVTGCRCPTAGPPRNEEVLIISLAYQARKPQTTAMKNLPRTLACLVLTAAIFLAAKVLVLAETKDDGNDYKHVMIAEEGVIIPLKAKVSKDDCTKMNQILQKYDKSLYKIEMYVKGESKHSRGTLSELCLDKRVYAQLTKDAQNSGLSDCTMQIGIKIGPESGIKIGPESGIKIGPEKCPIDHAKAKELVKKLKPILEKYTKR
jgi:hypothetical protein